MGVSWSVIFLSMTKIVKKRRKQEKWRIAHCKMFCSNVLDVHLTVDFYGCHLNARVSKIVH